MCPWIIIKLSHRSVSLVDKAFWRNCMQKLLLHLDFVPSEASLAQTSNRS